jgi:hypothetical protein
MAYSARLLSTNALQNPVFQAAHGFTVGQLLAFNGDYYLGDASTQVDAEIVGMVSAVADNNHFWVSQMGYLSNLTGPFTPGGLYYLSTSPGSGALTPVAPSNIGEVVLPCFIADSSTSGYFFASVGELIVPPSSVPWVTVTTDTVMLVNHGYWVNSGSELNMTLPVTMGTSDSIEVACPRAGGGFKIKQNASQYIDFIDKRTTTGTGGNIELTTTNGVIGGSIKVNCNTTNTGFMVTGSTGNYNVT